MKRVALLVAAALALSRAAAAQPTTYVYGHWPTTEVSVITTLGDSLRADTIGGRVTRNLGDRLAAELAFDGKRGGTTDSRYGALLVDVRVVDHRARAPRVFLMAGAARGF